MVITRMRLASNVGLSVLQVIVSGLLLFFLYRYLLKQIGAEQLGLWSLILASTAVARLSDLGFTGGVVKFVARYRSKGDLVQAAGVVETTVLTIATVMAVLLVSTYPLLVRILGWTVPPQSLALALEILPWAMLAFWVNSVAGVFQAALDGCQQAGYKNVILIAGNTFFLICVVEFLPQYGLIALAFSQLAQAMLLMLTSWMLLRRYLPQLPRVPLRWSKTLFREMFAYSVNFQITAIAVLLCDPVTKILMSRYGGLSATAFYEMASQLINKVRALLVSANQVVVPVVAEMHEATPEKVRGVYVQSYAAVFFVAMPIYSLLLLLLPLIAEIWLGKIDLTFLTFAAILVAANFINNLEVPAHFDNLGTGHLRWNTLAHIAMAVLNIFFGLVLGYFWGSIGVAIGAAAAIVLASAMVLLAVNKKYRLPLHALVPQEHRKFAIFILIAFVSCFLYLSKVLMRDENIFVGTGVVTTVFLCTCIASTWTHPYKDMVVKRLFVTKLNA